MYKDHKEERASRPVVTGCNSNTRGFSNRVSDLLESVNKANQDPYLVISGEDMLARIEKYNLKAEEIIREGRDRLCEKMKCKNNECKVDKNEEIMKYRTHQYTENPGMMISGEDVHCTYGDGL